jgi:hypothetical protein
MPNSSIPDPLSKPIPKYSQRLNQSSHDSTRTLYFAQHSPIIPLTTKALSSYPIPHRQKCNHKHTERKLEQPIREEANRFA